MFSTKISSSDNKKILLTTRNVRLDSFDVFMLLLVILQPKIPQNALEKSTQCNMGVYDKVLPF